MRRKIAIMTAVALVLGAWLGSGSLAQERKGVMGDEPMTHKGMMMSAGEKGQYRMMGQCPMGGMMKGMMEKSMIAAADGGVIVLAGNKLIKYDKDLNVVKEVEIRIDLEAMKKNMEEMMKNCPMMKDGTMKAGMIGNIPVPAAPAASGAAEESE